MSMIGRVGRVARGGSSQLGCRVANSEKSKASAKKVSVHGMWGRHPWASRSNHHNLIGQIL